MRDGITLEQMNAVADKLLGIPYAEGECSPFGCNCTGLVCLFFQGLGFDLPFPISHDPAEVLAHDFASYFDPMPPWDGPKDGDVCRMQAKAGEPRHIGILIGGNVLHVHHRRDVVRSPRRIIPVAAWYRLNDKAVRRA